MTWVRNAFQASLQQHPNPELDFTCVGPKNAFKSKHLLCSSAWAEPEADTLSSAVGGWEMHCLSVF